MENARRTLGLVLLLLAGCGRIEVSNSQGPDLLAAWRASVPDQDVSERTWQTLRSLDLAQLWNDRPGETVQRVYQTAIRDPRPDHVFTLAEISYLTGRRLGHKDPCQALTYYYLCAGAAYHYLFGSPTGAAFDPRYRLACDLYNTSLTRCLQAAQAAGRLDPRQDLQVSTCDGQEFRLSVRHHGFAWKPEEFGQLLPCSNFRTEGLTVHRTYGLGVPLIALRSANAPDPGHGHFPREVSFPVTAFFRFEGTLADLMTRRSGTLELYNPLTVQGVLINGRETPLETDLTTPLAFYLSRNDLDRVAYTGFLRPDRLEQVKGVYMLEPYQPGKIPVLMVHGLLSSPMTWAAMFNDLRADPELRAKYQFWFYLYPTANPWLTSAADLRQELIQMRQRFDPQHRDPALDRMVCVGHSMGGLLSRLLTVDSGDDFWKLVSDRSLAELNLSPQTRKELARIFYFKALPEVSRVIFVGTPHHGSNLSPSLPARIARRFIRLPRHILETAEELVRADGNAHLRPERLPTSLELLAPHAPALEVLASRPVPEGVQYHSIIGKAPLSASVAVSRFAAGERVNEPGDGVVLLASARIGGVASELIVPADHASVHQHPQSVAEVRRILLEHLRSR